MTPALIIACALAWLAASLFVALRLFDPQPLHDARGEQSERGKTHQHRSAE